MEDIAYLMEKALDIRRIIVRMAFDAGSERKAHPGPALSSVDIVAALYFHSMRIDSANPGWKDRDRFILSKGHASPVLYSVLSELNFFDKGQLNSFRRINGMLQGHPDMKKIPGVDMTTGSLGHGLSAGLGMALASKADKKGYQVFVLLGDGECQEGLVWEAAMSAARYKLDNLIAIVDVNGYQSSDKVENVMPMEPFRLKWISFGWNTIEIDGHDMEQIVCALELAIRHKADPTVIIAHTVKGKGISFMENDNSWHQRWPDENQFKMAMKELGVV